MFARGAFLLVLLILSRSAVAGEIYVDNVIGLDGSDGASPMRIGLATGPVESLERAMRLAGFGDLIVLANTGRPYYGSLSLTGERHSGTQFRPFVIQGNGAVISGLRSVPPSGWSQVDRNLWKLTLTRKGFYRLVRDGQSIPEYLPASGEDPLLKLEPGKWVAWKGSLYFRQDGVDPPERQAFAYAAEQTGISLHHVEHVLIKDVTLQHFRFDGIHAQGLCNNVILDKVNSLENGRAGVVSSGASRMELFGVRIAGNGRHQLLVTDRSQAIPTDCAIDE